MSHVATNGVKTMSEVKVSAKPATKAETKEQNTGLQAGAEAQGWALAQSAIAEAKDESTTWNCYVGRLIGLSVEARSEFIKAIRKHVQTITEHVKASGGDKETRKPYQMMSASARVRLSELTTIAHALNSGLVISVKVDEMKRIVRDSRGNVQPRDPFYSNVGNARMLLRTEGTASTKGRKRDPFIVAAVKYIDKRDPAPGEENTKEKMLAVIAKAFPAEFAEAHAKADKE
jgi:hypothetical protein